MAGRAEHRRVAAGRPSKAVRRLVGLIVSFCFDDDAPDTSDPKLTADQVRRDSRGSPAEETQSNKLLNLKDHSDATGSCGLA